MFVPEKSFKLSLMFARAYLSEVGKLLPETLKVGAFISLALHGQCSTNVHNPICADLPKELMACKHAGMIT